MARATCSVQPIRNGSPNWWRFVTVRGDPSPFVCSPDMSAIERCLSQLRLWRHYFGTRNNITLRLFIWVVCGSSRAVTNCHPFWRPVSDRYDFLGCPCTCSYCANFKDIADCSTCFIPFSTQPFLWKKTCAICFIRTSETNGLMWVGTCLLRLEVQNICTVLAWQVSLLRNISSKWYSQQIPWQYMYNIQAYITCACVLTNLKHNIHTTITNVTCSCEIRPCSTNASGEVIFMHGR